MAQPTLREILQGVPQAARTLKALGRNTLKPIYDDYAQLWGEGSNLRNDAELLRNKISQHIPPNEAFRSPQAMGDWSLRAALNAPMGLSLKGLPKTEFSNAHEIAQKNAALPVEKGGLGLPPNNTAMDRARAMGMPFKKGLITNNEGRADVIVNYSKDNAGTAFIDTNGQARLILDPVHKRYKSELPYRAFRHIDDMLYPYEADTYIRTSSNLDDLNHLKNGTHRGSRNWSTGESEGGLSVSKSPEFYSDNMSLVSGKKIGDGSDSEPILDIDTVNYIDEFNFKKFNKDIYNKAKLLGLSKEDVKKLKISPKFSPDDNDLKAGIRSKLAAFDPMKKDSSNILASILGGTALASQYKKDNKK